MTSKEMVDWIGVKCDDIDKVRFQDGIRYIALNEAVKKVIDNVENYYLRELFTVLTDQELDSDGAIDVSSFVVAPYSQTNGIVEVVTLMECPKPLDLKSYEEYMELVRRGVLTYDRPGEYKSGIYLYYFIGSKIYCTPGNYDVDIAYIRQPATINASTSCDLDSIFHVDIAELACAILMSDINRQAVILNDIRNNYANRARATDSNMNENFERRGFYIPKQILRIDTD